MIKSMTAFSKAEQCNNGLTAAVEIRSYNSRHLDLNIRVPHGYSMFEEKIKEVVSSVLTRGRVEIRLHLKDDSEAANEYEVNFQKADAYMKALKTLADHCGTDRDIPVNLLSGVQGVIIPAEVEADVDGHWMVTEACIRSALNELERMRTIEGDYIKADFQNRLEFIEKTINEIDENSSDLLAVYQKRLSDRIHSLTGGLVEIDEGRIAQEAALLAERSDISEEIVRANSHVKQFRTIMDSDEPGGRKLNFLLQEFNREFNTMGSKAGNAGIAHKIVNVKSELEKQR